MRVGGLCEPGADPLAAVGRVDGDRHDALRDVRVPPCPARVCPADDLAVLLVGEQAKPGMLGDAPEEVGHAVGRDDAVGPRPLAHRRDARDVLECSFAEHGATVPPWPGRSRPVGLRRPRLASEP